MEVKKEDKDFFVKVLDGIRKASRKMAERSAANNEDLVIADKNGNPVSVPAKELLKNL
ncbi:MAG: hypothetical protein H7Y07_07400 [Pyrinomonadaceae bacterium]|nr:hypothetical protein [Sphingobacteriaceae bacterium]